LRITDTPLLKNAKKVKKIKTLITVLVQYVVNKIALINTAVFGG